MHVIRQGLQSTKEKTPYTDLEHNSKTNAVFLHLWTILQLRKEIFTHIYADACPPHQSEETNTSMSCMYMIVISY